MLKYKNCSICNVKQKIINFYAKGSQCKSCLTEKKKKYYRRNKIILPYYSMEDDNFRKCWNLDNLRPLRADLNIVEGATRIRHGALYGQK